MIFIKDRLPEGQIPENKMTKSHCRLEFWHFKK